MFSASFEKKVIVEPFQITVATTRQPEIGRSNNIVPKQYSVRSQNGTFSLEKWLKTVQTLSDFFLKIVMEYKSSNWSRVQSAIVHLL